jgi:hypothetical protein
MRKGIRERWLPYVYAADIDAGTRQLLLTLYMLMTPAGMVSVPRKELAELFGCSSDLVSQWVSRAVKAGLLSKCGGGYPGRVAEYEAILPTSNGCVRTQPLIGQILGRDARQDSTINRTSRRAKSGMSSKWLRQDSTHSARASTNAGVVRDTPSSEDGSDSRVGSRSAPQLRERQGVRGAGEAPRPPTEVADARLNHAERDFRVPETDHSSGQPTHHNADQPRTVTTPDPATLELAQPLTPEETADLEAKDQARRAQLGYRRTGGIP